MAYLVTYIGAKWCKTCGTIQQQIEDLCKRFQVTMCIKDLDEDCDEEEKNDITKVPTIYITKGDQSIAKYDVNQVKSVEELFQQSTLLSNDADF